jgi:membrane-associated phospholipid phosphatase
VEKQQRALIAGFLAAVGALTIFAVLARDVLEGQTIRFDATIRGAIHSFASPGLTMAMRGITWLGSPFFLVIVAAVLIWQLAMRGRHRAAVLLVAASVGAEALDQILKFVFRRARPSPFFNIHAMGYSFPSGHSIASACFYGVVAAILTVRMKSVPGKAAIWAGAAILALAIGISRIYLGVHYPSDVLAGYAAAVIWVTAVRAAYEIWLRRRSRIKEDPSR